VSEKTGSGGGDGGGGVTFARHHHHCRRHHHHHHRYGRLGSLYIIMMIFFSTLSVFSLSVRAPRTVPAVRPSSAGAAALDLPLTTGHCKRSPATPPNGSPAQLHGTRGVEQRACPRRWTPDPAYSSVAPARQSPRRRSIRSRYTRLRDPAARQNPTVMFFSFFNHPRGALANRALSFRV